MINFNGVELPTHLTVSMKKIIHNKGFKNCTLEAKHMTTSGGNYLGDLFEVSITEKTDKCNKELHIFIKNMIANEDKITFLCLKDMYLKEIFVYNELSVLYQELQNEGNVPETLRFRITKFYDTSNPNALILENMTKKGFGVPERQSVIPLSFAKVSVEQLAKFHALSFVTQKMRPDYFTKSITCKTTPFIFNDSWYELIGNSFGSAIESLESDEAKHKLKKFLEKVMHKYNHYYDKNQSQVNVLCHGDYRAMNILRREEHGQTIEVIPVDFQTIHYGNPSMDFIYFIFGATDQDFRKNHLDYLKKLYFDTLKSFLLYFDVNVEDIYNREAFERDYKERLDYGLITAIQWMPYIQAREDDFPNFSKDNARSVKHSKSDIYVKLVNDIVDDFITWGYL